MQVLFKAIYSTMLRSQQLGKSHQTNIMQGNHVKQIISLGYTKNHNNYLRHNQQYYHHQGNSLRGTGKSFSEALILASNNPQYDKRLFTDTMNNLLSYCGLIDAKIRASDKDLPVLTNVWASVVQVHQKALDKVEKILKGSLDSIPSPSPSVKIKIMGGKSLLEV